MEQVLERFKSYSPVLIDSASAPVRAGVAIIMKDGSGGIEFLFIKRAERADDPWSGHMAFPGGRQEPGIDADIMGTVVREVREEVNIDLLAQARFIGRADDIRAVGRGKVLRMAISVFLFEAVGRVDALPSREVVEILWIPVSALIDRGNVRIKPYSIEGMTYDLPSIHYNGYIIWGLTLRMLANVCRILELPIPSNEFVIPEALR